MFIFYLHIVYNILLAYFSVLCYYINIEENNKRKAQKVRQIMGEQLGKQIKATRRTGKALEVNGLRIEANKTAGGYMVTDLQDGERLEQACDFRKALYLAQVYGLKK